MILRKYMKRFVYRLRGQYTVEQLVEMGLKVGKNFNPQLGVELDPSHCWLISIGDDVTIAPHAQILAHDASTCVHLGYARIGTVEIGDRVFIGAGAIILPGTCIGKDTVIGAGAVVKGELQPGRVYAGNPAREICTLDEFLEKHRAGMKRGPVYDESYTLRKGITGEKKKKQAEEIKKNGGYVL